MFDNVKNRVNKAKHFAQRHHTLVACAATSVITYKVTRNVTLKKAFAEAGEYVYEVGRENGHMMLQNRVMLDFINQHEMGDELKNHILSMRD